MNSVNSILNKYWGYTTFRALQQDIINAVLQKNDVLALLPTGGGKSICFQIPALAMDGVCIVVSPLIALIKDQVEALKKRGINTLSIYSGMSFLEVKQTLQNAANGNYKFLYVSPERLETKLFLEYLPSINICLIAVDEAHCISQWGYDFRPPYLRIVNLRKELPGVPIIALTASATKEVQDDIIEKLEFTKHAKKFQQSFTRPNLSYSVFNVDSKQNKLLKIVQNVSGTAIVYCKSRKHTKEIADLLKLQNLSADYYHAGLSTAERNEKQQNWINNKTRIIVCTNAFGMGIDKPDVRLVIHYNAPDCLENYYQEAGRAGRDTKKAYAVLLYNKKEITDLKDQVSIRFPELVKIKEVYISLMNYLQVAAGTGEGLSFDFDIITFCKNFKLDVLTTTYSLKILEQENILLFSETFFKPSTLVFTTTKETLEDLCKTNAEYEKVIKGLLRSYEGVFDFVTSINEKQLAAFVKLNILDIKKILTQLHQIQILQYSPQKDFPQIYLLQNRMYSDSFLLNYTSIEKRRNEYQKRIEHFVDYIENTSLCRSVQIATYFNDFTTENCGVCDNCLNNKQTELTPELFNEIKEAIYEVISTSNYTQENLFKKFRKYSNKNLSATLNYLQKEEEIVIDKNGNIILKNNLH